MVMVIGDGDGDSDEDGMSSREKLLMQMVMIMMETMPRQEATCHLHGGYELCWRRMRWNRGKTK